MKHAGPAAIAELADLIGKIRARGVKEPRPGIFYRKGKAWLHFHEDPTGLFADIRLGADWERHKVSTAKQRAALLAMIDRSLAHG